MPCALSQGQRLKCWRQEACCRSMETTKADLAIEANRMALPSQNGPVIWPNGVDIAADAMDDGIRG